MTMSVSSALASAGYSWSASGKDQNGDGQITRAEFKMPVTQGTSALVPADLQSGGSLDDAFNANDRNGDGIIDGAEAREGPKATQHSADRFTPNWTESMSTQAVSAYFKTIDADNASLAKSWGLQT